jgi:RimJ/RimL family protein N-acetyltransferase
MVKHLDRVGRLWSELQVHSCSDLFQRAARQVYREWHAYGLRRDLKVHFETPRAQIPLMVRPLRDQDISRLFAGTQVRVSRQARLEEANRVALLAERCAKPFVAVDLADDRPCFVQWMFTARSNDFIRRYFRGRFPRLADNEALLEFAFTPPEYRGRGIMPAAMSMVAEQGEQHGVRYVTTFVLRENSAALKGCAKAGFSPFTIRHDRAFLLGLVRRRSFSPIGTELSDRSVEVERRTLVEGQS